jgi:pilus assembly protein CpaC
MKIKLIVLYFVLPISVMAQEITSEATNIADVVSSETETKTTEEVKPVSKRMTKKPSEYRVSRYTTDRSEQEADRVDLWLGVGLDRIYDLDPEIKLGDRTGSILESNTNIVKVVPVTIGDKRQFIFKGLAEGNANVTIRDKSGVIKIIYNVVVAKQDLLRLMEDLKRNVKEVEGINIFIEGSKIVVSGEVLTPNDYGTLVNVITDKQYADAVSNRVVMSGVTLNALAKKIEQDLQVFAQTVRATVLNGKIILEGTVESEGVRQRALRRAEWYLPTVRLSEPINKDTTNVEKNDKQLQIIQNDIQITPPQPKRESKLLRLSVYFVELSKDFLKSFGFKWQPGFTADPSISIGTATDGGTGSSNSGGFTFSGTLSSLFPAINSTPASSAYGRILKSATMVVKSAERAKMSDTQEIPTQTLGQNGTVGAGTPVKVGFDVEITPTILQGQDVDLSIDLDQVNALGKGLGGATITAKHHVTSRLYVKSGEVAAVAGINNNDVNTTFNRDDPNTGTFAAGTRPLFTLQRSKSMSKKKGQFVVFVSPQIIESASEGTEDLRKNFRMKSN